MIGQSNYFGLSLFYDAQMKIALLFIAAITYFKVSAINFLFGVLNPLLRADLAFFIGTPTANKRRENFWFE